MVCVQKACKLHIPYCYGDRCFHRIRNCVSPRICENPKFVQPIGKQFLSVTGVRAKHIEAVQHSGVGAIIAHNLESSTDPIPVMGAEGDDGFSSKIVLRKKGCHRLGENGVADRLPVWSQRHTETVVDRLVANVYPEIGDTPIASLEPVDVLRMVKKSETRGAKEVAKRVLGICALIFRYAMEERRKLMQDWADMLDSLKAVCCKSESAYALTFNSCHMGQRPSFTGAGKSPDLIHL